MNKKIQKVWDKVFDIITINISKAPSDNKTIVFVKVAPDDSPFNAQKEAELLYMILENGIPDSVLIRLRDLLNDRDNVVNNYLRISKTRHGRRLQKAFE